MVVDSSAIIAIVLAETDASRFYDLLNQSSDSACSAVTFVECAMVLIGGRAQLPLTDVTELFDKLRIRRLDIDGEQTLLAAKAFQAFGKGRHPAKLNLGDCFSYALAKSLNASLLFKGDDFSQTDIVPAIAAGAAGHEQSR
jgi:ribonuclease VapC